MGEVTNTAVVSNDRAWKQAFPPVKLGRLGVGSAVELGPSAYLASLHATSALDETILPLSLPPSSQVCLMMSFHAGRRVMTFDLLQVRVPLSRNPGTT